MSFQNEIENDSRIPIYEQVMKLIKSDIEQGIFRQGDRIPSINETSEEYGIARDTVEKAYKKLREDGVLISVPGKGFYVANTDLNNIFRVCLIFNKLSNYKKETYDSFIKVLESKATVDLFIYNFNIKVFEKIVTNNINNYDYFVIVPHFHHGSQGLVDIVKKIPNEKVLIIDKKINQLIDEYPTVYQDFESDIFTALEEGLQLIKKYSKLILAFRRERFFSLEILNGFTGFCKVYNINYSVIDRIEDEQVNPGEAYVIISDEDLVHLIKKAKIKGYGLGNDIGVISYNENPMKEILENGITTISTNHHALGEMAAKMLLSKSKARIKIPFTFNRRNSL